jgi:Leucine-rich repeat (LRR) protein
LAQKRFVEVMTANQNNLTGTIPSEIGRCTNLTTLDLGFNRLEGTMPGELGSLTALGTWRCVLSSPGLLARFLD